MKKKLVGLLCLTLCCSLLLTGCQLDLKKITQFVTGREIENAPPEEETPSDEGENEMAADAVLNVIEGPETLQLAYQEQYGLNPFTCESLCNRVIFAYLYEPLYVVNDRFQAEAVLAADCETSDDGKSAVIRLRRGVRFHSGEKLTAEDVAYSYTMAAASNYYSSRFQHIRSLEAQEDGTVLITTDTSMERIELLLDFPIVRSETGEESLPDGTGPFTYDGSNNLHKWESWWRSEYPLGYDSISLTPSDTATDIRDNFEYSRVNLVCTDPNSAAYATYHSDYELWSSPTTIMQYVGFNLNSKPFASAAVRKAVTYAVDRETIVAQDLGGFAEAAALPANPLSPYYNAGLAAGYNYDLEKFALQLEEAQVADYTGDGKLDVYYKGYAQTVGGKMIVNATSTQKVATANRIADTLNELGFDIQVSALEDTEFRNAMRYGRYDLYYGEVRLSPNFDLGPFFRDGGALSYGDLSSGTMLSLCASMLENSGNAYDLHRRLMEHGYFCPVLFKSYAIYTTRGLTEQLSPALDWTVLSGETE